MYKKLCRNRRSKPLVKSSLVSCVQERGPIIAVDVATYTGLSPRRAASQLNACPDVVVVGKSKYGNINLYDCIDKYSLEQLGVFLDDKEFHKASRIKIRLYLEELVQS